MQYWSTATRNRFKLYQRIVALELMFVEDAYTYVGNVCLRFGLHISSQSSVSVRLGSPHSTVLLGMAADILLDLGADIESKSKDVHRCSLLLICECIM